MDGETNNIHLKLQKPKLFGGLSGYNVPSNFGASIKIQQKQQPSFSLKFGASIKISLLSTRPFILDKRVNLFF